MAMSEKMVLKLRALLQKRKRELFIQIAHLKMGNKVQEERVIEPGDAAQKEDLTRLLDHLIERGKEEIREINLAFERMAAGKFGICEICGRQIQSKRLNALPVTRLCLECAREFEKIKKIRQHPKDEIVDDDLLIEYRYWLDEDLPPGVARLSKNAKPLDLKKS